MKRIISALVFGLTLIIVSCKHELPIDTILTNVPTVTTSTCDSDTVYFQEQILPILMGCATTDCHDAASHEDGVILDNYLNIINTGDVTPFNPGDSEIYEKITDNDPDDIMPPPPAPPLSQSKIDLIYTWINQGALNNSCPDAFCDTLDVTFSGQVFPMIDAFCIQCHSGIMPVGVVHLDDYNDIVATINNTGPSFLDIIDGTNEVVMPPNTNGLSDCQVRMFEMWIENGKPND